MVATDCPNISTLACFLPCATQVYEIQLREVCQWHSPPALPHSLSLKAGSLPPGCRSSAARRKQMQGKCRSGRKHNRCTVCLNSRGPGTDRVTEWASETGGSACHFAPDSLSLTTFTLFPQLPGKLHGDGELGAARPERGHLKSGTSCLRFPSGTSPLATAGDRLPRPRPGLCYAGAAGSAPSVLPQGATGADTAPALG